MKAPITGPLPFVSVVMPIRNEADFIAEGLGAVLGQDYPKDRMEVLVADGMSTDATREIVTRLAARPDQPAVTLIDNPGQIVATGLNLALRQARGEIIVRVDGHCRIEPDYVSQCVAHLRNDGVEGVGGPITTVAKTPVGRAIAAAMSSPFGVGGSAFRTVSDRTLFVDTIAFPAYTRQAVERAGPFDEELVRNQDDEYNYRLRGLGARLLLTPDVRSEYHSRSSYRSLWRQYFQYGYYKVRVMRKHPRQMRWRQFVPPAFVLVLALGLLASAFGTVPRLLFGLMLLTYLAAVLGASIWTAAQRDWSLVGRLPLAFVILHVSYGLGFLVGLASSGGRARLRHASVPTKEPT
jgi:cellulose synthase/poly-beta-1,6-N-acetylglucosamine synthase-like glycosyltransferase